MWREIVRGVESDAQNYRWVASLEMQTYLALRLEGCVAQVFSVPT